MNKALFFGQVLDDPKIRYDESGNKEMTFTLETTDFITKNGERIIEKTIHTIAAKEKYADRIQKHIAKGIDLIIEGKITYPVYKNRFGITHTATEIVCNNFRITAKKKVYEPSLANI